MNGQSVRIADPYTGYDLNGNYDGTPANITEGSQDESALFHVYGFNKYIKCTSNGTIELNIQGDYSYRFWNGSAWSTVTGTITTGNYLSIVMTAGQMFGLLTMDSVFISYLQSEWHTVSGTFIDWVVIGDASNSGYDRAGNTLHFGTAGIKPLGAIEFNPEREDDLGEECITNGNNITSNDFTLIAGWSASNGRAYFNGTDNASNLIQIDANNQTSVKIDTDYILGFEIRDASTFARLYILNSGGGIAFISINDYANGINEVEFTTPSIISGGGLSFYAYIGGSSFNMGNITLREKLTTISEPTELQIFDRRNVLDFGFYTEFYKSQILVGFDPSHPYRHDLTLLRSNGYFRTFGLKVTSNSLFWIELITAGTNVELKTGLKYNRPLSATEKARVYAYAKDPTKTNLIAWDAKQASGIVAYYDFNKLACYTNDGLIANFGWEGEDIALNGDLATGDFTGWTAGLNWSVNGSNQAAADGVASNYLANNIAVEIGDIIKITEDVIALSDNGGMIITSGWGASNTASLNTIDVGKTIEKIIIAGTTRVSFYNPIGKTGTIANIKIEKVGNLVNTVLDVGGGMNGLGDILDGWDFNNYTDASIESKTSSSFTTLGAGGVFKNLLTVGTKYHWRIKGITSCVSGVQLPNTDELPIIPNGDFDTTIKFTHNTNGNFYVKNLSAGITTFTKSELVEVTYYPLSQSDLNLQGKKIPNGIELHADTEYDVNSACNGKECYIEEIDGTFTNHFTVASSKITAAEIYAEISSYQIKSLRLIDET